MGSPVCIRWAICLFSSEGKFQVSYRSLAYLCVPRCVDFALIYFLAVSYTVGGTIIRGVACCSGLSPFSGDVVLSSGYGFLYFFSDVAYSMKGFNITYRLVRN